MSNGAKYNFLKQSKKIRKWSLCVCKGKDAVLYRIFEKDLTEKVALDKRQESEGGGHAGVHLFSNIS